MESGVTPFFLPISENQGVQDTITKKTMEQQLNLHDKQESPPVHNIGELNTFHHKIYEDVPLTADIAFYWFTTEVSEHKVTTLWIEWAQKLLQAGYSSTQIIQLSQFTNTENQITLIGLTNVILDELSIDINDFGTILKYKAIYCIQLKLESNENVFSILESLEKIFLDYPAAFLYDFHVLYLAYKELREEGEQNYWEGLSFRNKEMYVKQYLNNWIKKPQSQLYQKWEKKPRIQKIVEYYLLNKYALTLSFVIIVSIISYCFWLMYKLSEDNIITKVMPIFGFIIFIMNLIFYIAKINNKKS